MQRIGTSEATAKDVDSVRKYLRSHKDGRLAAAGFVYSLLQTSFAEKMLHTSNEGTRKVLSTMLEAAVDNVEAELMDGCSTDSERLIAQQVAVAYLRLLHAQHKYDESVQKGSERLIRFWDKTLTSCHRRYLRSVETLARVRRYDVQIAEKQGRGGETERSLRVRANG